MLAFTLVVSFLTGVLAYSVARRTNEIGIRMALGAQTADVLRMVIWQGMKLVLLGLAVGAASGYVLKRLLAQTQMAEQLYGVTMTDPMTAIVIALLLIFVALVACWIPARRATKYSLQGRDLPFYSSLFRSKNQKNPYSLKASW